MVSRLCGATFRSGAPAFDTAETRQKHREYPRQFGKKMGGRKIPVRGCRIFLTPSFCQKDGRFKPKPQPSRRMGALFLCPHSSVLPRAPPIYHDNGSGRFPAITSTDHLWRVVQRGPHIVVRTVPCAALGPETTLPHRGLCGPLFRTAPAFLRAVKIVVRTVPCAAPSQETPLPVLRRAIS